MSGLEVRTTNALPYRPRGRGGDARGGDVKGRTMLGCMKARLGWAAVIGALVGCGGGGTGGGGGTPAPGTAAVVLLSLKNGTTNGTVECSDMRIVWRLEPLNLTGPDGRSEALTIDKTYSAHKQPGGLGFICYYDESVAGLRTGSWRIGANPTTGGTSCEETLVAGANLIHFASDRQGCVRGTGYPGD